MPPAGTPAVNDVCSPFQTASDVPGQDPVRQWYDSRTAFVPVEAQLSVPVLVNEIETELLLPEIMLPAVLSAPHVTA